MDATTIIKLSMNQLNAEKLVNYLLNNNIKLSGNVLISLLGSYNMYKNIINNYVEENSTVIIIDTKLVNYYINNITNKNIKVKTINVKENNIKNFILQLKNMPKFDYIIQNPPYSGDLHLKFFEAGLNMLSENGKMIIIEPSTWLIQLKENSKYTKEKSLTVQLKKRIKNHVNKVVIENYNELFKTGNDVPFSITYIDFSKTYNLIDFYNCGLFSQVNSLYDCNLIGLYKIISSIKSKLQYGDKIVNHIYYPGKSIKHQNMYYCKFTGIVTSPQRYHNTSYNIAYNWDSFYYKHQNNEYYNGYIKGAINDELNKWIWNDIPKVRKSGGGKSKIIRHSNKEAACIFGTKNEIENYKYFMFNNKLPLFIGFLFVIDAHTDIIRNYIPWLVDKQYTDEEIYKLFNFNKEEIKLIETTIKKYERYSPWFRRFFTGDTSIEINQIEPWK